VEQLLLKPEELLAVGVLTKTESDYLASTLGNAAVQKYFRILFHKSLQELGEGTCQTAEEKEKLALRFNRLQGRRDICQEIIRLFGPQGNNTP
jgi:hypothetical protein